MIEISDFSKWFIAMIKIQCKAFKGPGFDNTFPWHPVNLSCYHSRLIWKNMSTTTLRTFQYIDYQWVEWALIVYLFAYDQLVISFRIFHHAKIYQKSNQWQFKMVIIFYFYTIKTVEVLLSYLKWLSTIMFIIIIIIIIIYSFFSLRLCSSWVCSSTNF